MMNPYSNHRGLAGLDEQITTAVGNAIFGKPGTKQEDERKAFLSQTIADGASKFVKSPEGASVVTKVAVYSALPSFAAGMLVGWLLWRKR